MEKQNKMVYAYKGDSIVYIEDVERGQKCGCKCPACEKPLVAKKGPKKMHHFAHLKTKNCKYGFESSLHLAAKEILSKAKEIVTPPVYIQFPCSNKSDELIYKARKIKIDRVELEKHFDSIIPDVVLYSGEKKFFVEIYVTNRVDGTKLNKIRESKISTIEIDLSKNALVTPTDALEDILLNNNRPEKQWIYNIHSEKWLEKFISVSDKKDIIDKDNIPRVYNCPIDIQPSNNKPYVYYYEHCCHCPYHIATFDNEKYLFCSGKERISSQKDFNIPIGERETFSFPDKLKVNYSAYYNSFSEMSQQNPTYSTSDNGLYKCTKCGNSFPKDVMVIFFPEEGKNYFICRECGKTLK